MLYIVGTPIGNLDDLSLRQAKTLASSDFILAEDTRSAQTLIQGIKERFSVNFNSDQKLISYYKEKEFEKLPEIIDLLKEGKTVSLISESGMPLLSDPGYLLVKTVIKEGISFTVIPGPSSITTALIHSGFNPNEFMFLGFFPRKSNEAFQLNSKLESIKNIFSDISFVFFESPKRVQETLERLKEYKWINKIVICREMTKKFEENVRGKAEELMRRDYKGEITVIIQ